MITVNNTNGDIKWQVKLERPIRGAITEVGDYLYFGCTDGKVYCLKTESGVKVWDYQTDGTITASPIVHGRAVIIGSHDRHLYSLDKKTGRLIDRQSLRGPVTRAAVADGKYVFAACGKNRLYCFEAY
jgi:outer membrane protein assembly factor BamB